MPTLTSALPLLLAATVVAGPATARAQSPDAPDARPLTTAAAAIAGATPLADAPARKRRNTIALGAVIGAAGAAAVTAWAASSYGENEGGRFCVACFAQWSAIAVPVGAAAGAGVGWALKASAAPSRQPGLLPSAASGRVAPPRRKELAVTLTF
jgi:hypothetical protein